MKNKNEKRNFNFVALSKVNSWYSRLMSWITILGRTVSILYEDSKLKFMLLKMKNIVNKKYIWNVKSSLLLSWQREKLFLIFGFYSIQLCKNCLKKIKLSFWNSFTYMYGWICLLVQANNIVYSYENFSGFFYRVSSVL